MSSVVCFDVGMAGQISITENLAIDSTGGKVWKTAVILSQYLARNLNKYKLREPKKRVLELGAGCGLLSIVLARLGVNVVATDTPLMLEWLRSNIRNNIDHDSAFMPAIATLTWGETDVSSFEPPFDVVVGTDVVYSEHLVEPLLKTLISVCDHRSTVLLCVEQRSSFTHDIFMAKASELFIVKRIPSSKLAVSETDEFSIVLQLRLRSLSSPPSED